MNQFTNFIFGILISLSTAVSAILPVNQSTAISTHANMIIRSGEYSYSGQTLKYKVHIPKNGGKISGNLTGVCNGPIEGDYNSGPAKVVEGRAKATCPILLNKKLSVRYTAHLDLEKGKAYIDWQGDIPYTNGLGSFTFDFEPVN